MNETKKNNKSEANEVDYGKILAQWDFPEYNQYKRSKGWYMVTGMLFTLALIYSISTANFLFIVILILIAIIIIFHGRQSPGEVKFKIYEDGVEVGSKFYEWEGIKNFRVVYQPPNVKRLYFDLKRALIPDLSVPLQNQNPLEIRNILKKYLDEDLNKTEETISDRLSRWLKI